MKYILTGRQIEALIKGEGDPKEIYRNCPVLLEDRDFVWEKRAGGYGWWLTVAGGRYHINQTGSYLVVNDVTHPLGRTRRGNRRGIEKVFTEYFMGVTS